MSLLRRAWEALPRGLRREALFGTMAALAPRPTRPEPDGQGPVVVAGYLGASSGLGAGARRMLEGMRAQGLDPLPADLTGPLRQGPPGPPPAIPPGPGTIVLHVNGPMLPWALRALGRQAVAGKRLVANWAWELPTLPRDWDRGYNACHRIWAPSRFCADAFRRGGFPEPQIVPYTVPAPDPSARTRADFGLPPDAFVTLTLFDATSSLARKNPLGAIAAHARAFGDDPSRLLVLKTHGTAEAKGSWEPVARAAAGHSNVRVLDADLPRRDLWALMRECDALLSLHRSEGYGFAMAEAMAIGRPVVATGWSGNTDFMTGPGCFAVPWTLVPARDPQGTYDMPGTRWADPDTAAAAQALRRIAGDPSLQRPAPVRFAPPDYRAALAVPPEG
ncbi:glycosyltransferase family 4 protein [Roseomonas sp. OT10]|uniref:glycosyltransferase family 4 protein n=1 Tax=Roseomonas cutis TaxID=2897332 RepID=UPI001E2B5DED|nr:glycosyltransferase family 4 protein [Roseomonas sp. OT10]UFN48339.1 glycosyltransferase family 4 protein [Roseomonas sp. OT10]